MIKKENEKLFFFDRYFYLRNPPKISNKYRISMSLARLLDISSTCKNQ